MIIRELDIKNFGKLKNRRMVLGEGINLVYGRNESGKSTLYAYLKGMLFGLPRMRGRASRKDNYTRYEPWENPSRYGGSLRFSCGGKEFALHRNFHKDYPEAVLLCESDGEQLSLPDGDLDVLTGEISEAVYENTAAVGQIKTIPGKTLAEEVKRYLLNYETGRDGELDLKEAENYLKKEKKFKREKSREEKEKLSRHRERIAAQMEYLEGEISQLSMRSQKKQGEELRKNREDAERTGENALSLVIAGAAIAFAALLLTILLPWAGKAAAILFGILGEAFCVRTYQKKKRRLLRDEEKRERERKAAWRREELAEQKKEKEIRLANLKEEYEELLEQEARKNSWEEEEEAIDLAMETIRDVAKTMQGKTSSKLKNRTEEILSDLTNGKYGKLLIDGELNIRLFTGEKWTDLEQVSRGTIEQVYFALRMAVSETLEEGERLPVILDESFAMYDEERLDSALIWLYRCGRQVILLTCQKREEESLRRLEIPHQFLTL